MLMMCPLTLSWKSRRSKASDPTMSAEPTCHAIQELGAAIIEQAVSDWKRREWAIPDKDPHQGGKLRQSDVRDAENFLFKGDRMERCLHVFDLRLDPQAVREQLK